MLSPEDIKKERERFTEDNLSADNQSGMIIYDQKFADVKQVDSKPFTVNAVQMGQINENVFNYFGTSAGIIQTKYTEDEWNAYYEEGNRAPFALQLSSLVMSNMTFTPREIAHGKAIVFTANRLQYASNQTKLNISTQLFRSWSLLNRNGVMDIWNMAHVEGSGLKNTISTREYTRSFTAWKGGEHKCPVMKDQEYRSMVASVDGGGGKERRERFDKRIRCEGYATTFNKAVSSLYGVRRGAILLGVIDRNALVGADMSMLLSCNTAPQGKVLARLIGNKTLGIEADEAASLLPIYRKAVLLTRTFTKRSTAANYKMSWAFKVLERCIRRDTPHKEPF